MIDTITGQQTEATMLFERRVVQRMGEPLSAVRVPAVPKRQPGARPVPAHRHHPRACRPRRRQADGAPSTWALTDLLHSESSPRRDGRWRATRRLDQNANPLLPRRPGPDQGQGRRGLREDEDDDAGPALPTRTTWSETASASVISEADDALQRRESTRTRSASTAARSATERRRAAARAERHLPVEHEARPRAPRPSRRSAASSRSASPTTSSA